MTNACDASEFVFEVCDRADVGLALVEKAEGALEQAEDFRLVMFALGADFDELYEVSGGLRAQMMSADASERIGDVHFAQSVQGGFAAQYD